MSRTSTQRLLLAAFAGIALGIGFTWLQHDRSQPPGVPAPADRPGDPGTPAQGSEFRTDSSASDPQPNTRAGVNAADLYREAQAQVAALPQDERDYLDTLEKWLQAEGPAGDAEEPVSIIAPDGSTTEQRLARHLPPILELIVQAQRSAEYTDWGRGAMALDPKVAPLSVISELVSAIHAHAISISPRAPTAALADFGLAVTLAESIASAGPAGFTTAAALHHATIVALGAESGSLYSAENFAEIERLVWAFDVPGDFTRAVENSAEDLKALQSVVASANGSGDAGRKILRSLPSLGAEKPLEITDLLTFAAQSERLIAIERELLTRESSPQPDDLQWWDKVRAEANESRLLSAYVGQLDAMRLWLHVSVASRDVAAQGWVAMQAGDEQPPTIYDPFSERPLTVTRGPAGLEVSADTLYRGQPLRLRFVGLGRASGTVTAAETSAAVPELTSVPTGNVTTPAETSATGEAPEQ